MLHVVIDSREQAPFRFEGYPVEIEIGTLATGDYSLRGFEDRIAIERKELGDLIGCLTHDRERFARELTRLRGFESAAVVVESPFDELRAGRYRSQMRPEAALQSVLSIQSVYRMPFLFGRDRSDAERLTFDLLRHFARHAERRWRAIAGWNAEAAQRAPEPPT